MKAANDNAAPTPSGLSYYPEMGETPPATAIIHAQVSHYGRHYFLTFATSDQDQVVSLIRDAKLRFSDLETFETVKGGHKARLTMTTGAYDKFRKAHRALCTSAILLD